MAPDLQVLQSTWKTLLPDGVKIVTGPISDTAPPLTIEESASVGAIGPERVLELRAGRQYSKQALSLLGVEAAELPVLQDRSPAWPVGTTGSITHIRRLQEGCCAVAVALTAQFSSIGIDIEYQQIVPEEIWPTFLTVRELKDVARLNEVDRQADVLFRWCAKEAVIKARRARLDPLAFETERTAVDGQWHAFPNARPLNGAAVEEFRWSVNSAHAEGLVLAAVAVDQSDR